MNWNTFNLVLSVLFFLLFTISVSELNVPTIRFDFNHVSSTSASPVHSTRPNRKHKSKVSKVSTVLQPLSCPLRYEFTTKSVLAKDCFGCCPTSGDIPPETPKLLHFENPSSPYVRKDGTFDLDYW